MKNEFNYYEFKVANRLPSPSGVALQIMQILQQEDADLQKLAEMVKVDPALTSRILSVANSAAFGSRRAIVNVNDAVQMMGMNAVRNFALSLSLVGQRPQEQCRGFDYETYWMKSLAMAVAVAVVVSVDRTVSPEEAFTLGLLADIGQLAMATAWPDQYPACLEACSEEALLELEQERFAIDHRSLARLLMQDWGLPAFFLESLEQSFGPRQAEVDRTARFAGQLAFARLVAQYCVGDAQARSALSPKLLHEALLHNVDADTFDPFIDTIVRQWHEWGKLISIKTEAAPSLPASPEMPADQLPGLDILLVDDDPMLLARLSKQLTAAGHRIQVCRDGEAALKHILEHKPQLVITDWRMQPMDGLELCKTLRASEIGKKLYMIMLTVATSEDELVEAFDAGIDDYVTKPVNLRVLLARIRAGQRIVALQRELEKEKEEIQHYNAELAVANRRLGMMANTDMLTGLPNRRYALTRLEQEWKSAKRYQKHISVLLLDLDHFKSVNDSLGHDAGDSVLIHAAKIMKGAVRATDVACRFGGEEFLVILPCTDANTAMLLAERIRCAIQHQQPAGMELPRPLTVSVGVAGSMGDRLGWEELIKMADSALYRVKAGSRNAVLLA